MPIRQIDYKGFTIKAGAFEVGDAGRFMPSLTIGPSAGRSSPHSPILFNPPCPPELFKAAEDALEQALEFGRAVVDGRIPGLHTYGPQ